MVGRLSRLVTSWLCLALLTGPRAAAQAPAAQVQSLRGAPSALIIENVGQWDAAARFQVWGGQGTTWLAEDAIWISLVEPAPAEERGDPLSLLHSDDPLVTSPRKGANLRLSFDGANPHPRLEPFGPSETVVSYFYGNDPDKWRPDVPVWTGVRYVDLYPGLDLEISGTAGSWSWRTIDKGVGTSYMMSLRDVLLRVEGAEQVSLEGGALRVATAVGQVSVPLLQAMDAQGTPQVEPDKRVDTGGDVVTAPYATSTDGMALNAAPSTLLYSTFLGGGMGDLGWGIALDAAGRTYVLGETSSNDLPTTPGAFDTDTTWIYKTDAFVTLLNEDKSALVYSTFVRGSDWDWTTGLAVDGAGQAYFTGQTDSTDWPTTAGAYNCTPQHPDGSSAYVTVLNPTGSALVYSTFLGGTVWEWPGAIAVDGAGRAYVTGSTESQDYPTTVGAYDRSYNGGSADAFITVLNPTGTGLVYSTFLGGSGYDYVSGIAVDGAGRAHVTGPTWSTNYPTTVGAFDRTHSGSADVFVTVLNAAGSAPVYSTFLGGAERDYGYSIALDSAGRAYVAGGTESTAYPTTPGAYDTTHNGSGAFVSVVNAAGSALVYSTFLGADCGALAIAVDAGGRAYVTGSANSNAFPTTSTGFDQSHNGSNDAFVAVLNSTGTSLVYGTYLGGSISGIMGSDAGNDIAVDRKGHVHVVGRTFSADFPSTPGALVTTMVNGDAFLSVLATWPPSTHFDAASEWWDGLKTWAPQNRYPRMTGDVDGDGKDDVVVFNPDPTAPAGAGAYVALSTGSALLKPAQWTSEFAWLQGSQNWRALCDVNGDGMDDIVGFRPDAGSVYVALSTGSSYAPSSVWSTSYGSFTPQTTYPRLVGDVNADGKLKFLCDL